MATTETTTTKNIRFHCRLANGGSRYFDLENPTTDTAVIALNIGTLNNGFDPNDNANYVKLLASEEYFNGATDAYVTSVYSAETIEVQKTTTTNTVFSS